MSNVSKLRYCSLCILLDELVGDGWSSADGQLYQFDLFSLTNLDEKRLKLSNYFVVLVARSSGS